MNYCPITYEACGDSKYSRKGLKRLSRNLTCLSDLPYSAEEQIKEAAARADKMSIQGVQPKLSAVLSPKKGGFEIVDRGGRYILKPQVPAYFQVPENEDLTMRLAEIIGIAVPLHGLVYSKDGSMTYFVKRFDRVGREGKVAVEDFAQLSGQDRETKYHSSMEQVAHIIETFCTFPLIEKSRLFSRTLFSFLTGNEDCHLKNYSLIRRDPKVELSPAYDLVNTSIILDAKEEIALPINGKKRKLSSEDLIEYFGRERLGLTEKIVGQTVEGFKKVKTDWLRMISVSFLSREMKDKYFKLMNSRFERLHM
ncbi:MAG: HipA domain-containing protein [Proteobacteria bacterium]|nr:HipA domain-containing protein [Pseudomonadota bacterium]